MIYYISFNHPNDQAIQIWYCTQIVTIRVCNVMGPVSLVQFGEGTLWFGIVHTCWVVWLFELTFYNSLAQKTLSLAYFKKWLECHLARTIDIESTDVSLLKHLMEISIDLISHRFGCFFLRPMLPHSLYFWFQFTLHFKFQSCLLWRLRWLRCILGFLLLLLVSHAFH